MQPTLIFLGHKSPCIYPAQTQILVIRLSAQSVEVWVNLNFLWLLWIPRKCIPGSQTESPRSSLTARGNWRWFLFLGLLHWVKLRRWEQGWGNSRAILHHFLEEMTGQSEARYQLKWEVQPSKGHGQGKAARISVISPRSMRQMKGPEAEIKVQEKCSSRWNQKKNKPQNHAEKHFWEVRRAFSSPI